MQSQQNLSPCRNFDLRNLENQFFSPKKNKGQNKILELPSISQPEQNKCNMPQIFYNYQCPRCKDLMLKVQHLQKVNQEVQQLKEKNQEFREEVELLSANFMYIMELAAINIVSGVKSRVKEVLVQKQKIIKRQSQAIQRLESQSLTLINKMEDQTDFQEKIETLAEKVKKLQAENQTLKLENSKKSFKIQSQDSVRLDSMDGFSGTDGDRSPYINQKMDFHFGSLELKHFKSTMDQRRQQTLADVRLPRKLSPNQPKAINIDDLKTKIHKMKSVLLNQRI